MKVQETKEQECTWRLTQMQTKKELSRKLSELDIESKPNKLHEHEAGRNSIGPLVREINYLEGRILFDETQNQQGEAGGNYFRPQVLTVFDGLEGSKQIDKMQVGKTCRGSNYLPIGM